MKKTSAKAESLAPPRTPKGKARASIDRQGTQASINNANQETIAEDNGRAASPAPQDPSETAETELLPVPQRKKAKAKTMPNSTQSEAKSPTASSVAKGLVINQEVLDTQQESINQLLEERATSLADLQEMDKDVAELQSRLHKCEEGLQELTSNNAQRSEEIATSADQACNDARSNVDAANNRAQVAEDRMHELQRSIWKAKARIHKAECLLEQLEDGDLFIEELMMQEADLPEEAENPQEPQACLDQLMNSIEAEAPLPTIDLVDPALIEQVRDAEEKAVEAEEQAKMADERLAELESKLKASQAAAEEAEHRHQSMLEKVMWLTGTVEEESEPSSSSESDQDKTPRVQLSKSIPAKLGLGRLMSNFR